jgi:hypothetical protein
MLLVLQLSFAAVTAAIAAITAAGAKTATVAYDV